LNWLTDPLFQETIKIQCALAGLTQPDANPYACTLLMTPPRASAPERCMPSDLLSLARFCVSLLALACHSGTSSSDSATRGVLKEKLLCAATTWLTSQQLYPPIPQQQSTPPCLRSLSATGTALPRAHLVLQLDREVDVLLQAGRAVESSARLLLHSVGTL
jgi:hypothetical protein